MPWPSRPDLDRLRPDASKVLQVAGRIMGDDVERRHLIEHLLGRVADQERIESVDASSAVAGPEDPVHAVLQTLLLTRGRIQLLLSPCCCRACPYDDVALLVVLDCGVVHRLSRTLGLDVQLLVVGDELGRVAGGCSRRRRHRAQRNRRHHHDYRGATAARLRPRIRRLHDSHSSSDFTIRARADAPENP